MAYVGMLALSHRRLFCRSWRDEAIMMVAGLTGGYLYFITENTALKCAPAGIISLIVCLAPLFTALGALFTANKSGLTRRLWWGMAIALGGVALVVGRGEGPGANNMLFGGGLALMAAALWAVYQHVVKPLADKYGTALLTRKVFGYGLLAAIIGEPLLSLVSDAHGYSVIVAEVSPAHHSAARVGQPPLLGTHCLACLLLHLEQSGPTTRRSRIGQLHLSQSFDHLPLLGHLSRRTTHANDCLGRHSHSSRCLAGRGPTGRQRPTSFSNQIKITSHSLNTYGHQRHSRKHTV